MSGLDAYYLKNKKSKLKLVNEKHCLIQLFKIHH